ncbi:MAG: flagellar type III secretion system protein FlhB [Gammaproteobacteria bacterium]|nr:flagellar type III secretion system protein FlhB [Gammaproteobacteria bacterium]
MAENSDGQEKTEEPTQKRLQDSKRKGQIARSKELNTMAITLVGGMALVAMSGDFAQGLAEIMTTNFTIPRVDVFDTTALLRRLVGSIREALLILLPFFLIVVAIAIASSVSLGGMTFSAEALSPKLSKLNPLKGLKKMVSAKSMMELFKALAKFVLIGGTTGIVLWLTLGQFIALNTMALGPALSQLGTLVGWSFVLVASTLSVIAMIDVPFQLWDHKRQLKMTKQELKEEMKDTEGRPEVKGRIRNLQREMAQRRMMDEVPKADVIVTNPTHYAVALRYDQTSMQAPKLVAKGADLVAANIRRLGSQHDVPLVESPMLARAIFAHTELGDDIPAGLYLAVAKLLAYVFQLRAYRSDGGLRPDNPGDFPVPPELQVPEQRQTTT